MEIILKMEWGWWNDLDQTKFPTREDMYNHFSEEDLDDVDDFEENWWFRLKFNPHLEKDKSIFCAGCFHEGQNITNPTLIWNKDRFRPKNEFDPKIHNFLLISEYVGDSIIKTTENEKFILPECHSIIVEYCTSVGSLRESISMLGCGGSRYKTYKLRIHKNGTQRWQEFKILPE